MIAPHNDRGVDAMDPIIAALAQAAGLGKALSQFPDDVQAAAEQALNNAGVIQVPVDPAAEPWPPMRPGAGLAGGRA
jgi:thiamine pyrophosphate-dependent acetolactate synthase large subunit-like protein